jgi:hypothetical protein
MSKSSFLSGNFAPLDNSVTTTKIVNNAVTGAAITWPTEPS